MSLSNQYGPLCQHSLLASDLLDMPRVRRSAGFYSVGQYFHSDPDVRFLIISTLDMTILCKHFLVASHESTI